MKPHLLELLLLITTLLLCTPPTLATVHQDGYCVMRGQCGMEGFVSLNCPYNGPAVEPESEAFRQKLVETCGASFAEGPTCCDENQLGDLVNQIQQAVPIIGSCPACWNNFLQFWCSFTCSPNQSTFVNVTDLTTSDLVNQTDYWVGDNFGNQFYDSCKGIKFGGSNGYAMDLIGGGAKDWLGMVRFMGTKRPFAGSPIQIDFPPTDHDSTSMTRYDEDGRKCNDTAIDAHCACVDCEASCPVLDKVPEEEPECYIGQLKCWTFTMIMSYALILLFTAIVLLGRNIQFVHRLKEAFGLPTSDETRGIYERVALADDDEEEHLLDPDHTPRRYWLNSRLQSWFYRQGLICARYPWAVIFASLCFVFLASIGWKNFTVERDPVHLWVAPSSQALQEKTYFDEHFGPFYRATQLFLVSETEEPVINGDRLESLFGLEQEIRHMRSDPNGHTLQDVCFAPTGDACIVQSVTGYWQGDPDNFDPSNWKSDFDSCTREPAMCLPDFMQPLKPEMILGGFENESYADARAMVITIVLKNSIEESVAAKAEEWEKSLLRHILNSVNERPEWAGVRITYSTESSLETELNKSSNTDAKTVVISYVVMFIYASVALGRFRSWNIRRLFIDSKFGLGICGILIVIFSVSTAVGLFSLTGKKTTLIIAEVIPFLVLAVGVDNIFILCHEYARREEQTVDESVEDRIAKVLGKMGPSILLSSVSETIAFGLGTLVTMPAVSSFAIVASIAIFVDFVLQVTCFVSCMALDARRTDDKRLDCVPCIQIRAPETIDKEGWLSHLFRVYYVPFILTRKMQYCITLAFLGLFMFALSVAPDLPLGLDQRIALPSDSYLVPYFNDLDNYFNVGPPVYFVVRGANFTDRAIQQKACGRLTTCNERSVVTVLEQERKRPEVSYIGQPTSSWIDDYIYWLNPSIECCQFKQKRGRRSMLMQENLLESQYLRDKPELCSPDDFDCEACLPEWEPTMETLPQGQEFLTYLDLWLGMMPSESCPLAGRAAYGDAVLADENNVDVVASHFRTFHTHLKTQHDFIAAHQSARRIADQLGQELDLDIYPYSVFYIFFEQYSYIVMMAFELLGLAVFSIFIVTSSLLGSIRSGLIVMGVVLMILIDLAGVMTLWDISLNAVSLVNLVICVGISVEFCCHVARGFMVSRGSREERASKSMVDVGSSVFCGITLTKFAGIVVLAFTRSKIFEVYYFRMYLAIVVLGALHGLVLLPVLLSMYGGEGMALLGDFDEDGFVWTDNQDWGRDRRGLLIDDNNSSDQVLITDMPGEESDTDQSRSRA